MVNGNDSKIIASYTAHNKVTLIHGGREYFDLLEKMIDQAKDTIHLQVYIYDEDETGKRIAKALFKLTRSVKVIPVL